MPLTQKADKKFKREKLYTNLIHEHNVKFPNQIVAN
jgi:hypothetical protein